MPVADLQGLATGVHFCQLLHIYTHGQFSTKKVNLQAKREDECFTNFRLLDVGMGQAGLQKTLEVIPPICRSTNLLKRISRSS
jgi:hypothetical protein